VVISVVVQKPLVLPVSVVNAMMKILFAIPDWAILILAGALVRGNLNTAEWILKAVEGGLKALERILESVV
jgi:hypothetical protein